MEIIPAVLPKNFAEIEEKVPFVVGISKNIQIDICDGKFVPSITWPYWKDDENFHKILREERGMPEWENIDYEFDLMIQNPTEDDARKWLSAGASRIILHYESSDDLNPVIDILQDLVEIGIAIGQNTSVKDLEKYADRIQFIQCMGIRKAGFQGQQFEEKTLEKIREVKDLFPSLLIQVDGGVNLDNAKKLKDAGVHRIVVGSALFESEDIVETFNEFTQI